jgi:hypothetical protein
MAPEAAIKGWAVSQGQRLPCSMCVRSLLSIDDAPATSGLSGVIRRVRLQERTSISAYSVRRGEEIDMVRCVGRTAYYECLVCIIIFYYHKSFIIVFIYFSSIVHFKDKAGRGKYKSRCLDEYSFGDIS